MRLTRLHLRQFRAHVDTTLEPAPAVNLLHGPNGAGKTNVVEAIWYLGLGKSPFASSDMTVIQRGAGFFEVEGELESDRGTPVRVRVAFVPAEGKRVFVNGAPVERLADLVGRVPIVMLSPADHSLTAGGPEERRRFLDSTLSQATPAYLDDLLKYRRALRQRNALLQGIRRGAPAATTLAAWDAELIALGARLIEKRRRFLVDFERFLSQAFDSLGMHDERPALAYETVASLDGVEGETAVSDLFRRTLSRVASREVARGRTLAGPHLDEVVLSLNDFEVRPYASQGQHRSLGLALRLASFLYLRERLDETPILLLDDAFGPLDERRSRVVLELLQGDTVGQSVVTAARAEPFRATIDFEGSRHRAIGIASGSVAAPSRSENSPRAA